ncbi:DUF4406 domain-containing protein [Flavobacterium caeni]|uniref:DUF4406 domain-containing protein n=1 Tax=Flavobacterium caeni TaxID=490189 RepID=A0A1G5K2H4_9FLAO|nr:DUF4406 domain-containing protein [Flavobacterium caeni]SCY94421.1 protein of unknown function [Flavobacterium caeni]
MKTKGKIYISGAVADQPERELFAKFHDTEKMLAARGFEVVNPLRLISKWAEGIRWQLGAKNCLEALAGCTAIYMLPCATDCQIAQLELHRAMELNIDIYYELENVEADELVNDVHGQK